MAVAHETCSTVLVIRRIKLKSQDTSVHFLEWLKFKRLTIPSVGEDVENPELSHPASGNISGTTTLENSLAITKK